MNIERILEENNEFKNYKQKIELLQKQQLEEAQIQQKIINDNYQMQIDQVVTDLLKAETQIKFLTQQYEEEKIEKEKLSKKLEENSSNSNNNEMEARIEILHEYLKKAKEYIVLLKFENKSSIYYILYLIFI